MAVTDLQIREPGSAILPSKASNFVVTASKARQIFTEYALAVGVLSEWIETHRDISPTELISWNNPVRRILVQGSWDAFFRYCVVLDEAAELTVVGDTVLWYFGRREAINTATLPQRKRRQAGLFIKARRTRSPRRNFTYIRVPHR